MRKRSLLAVLLAMAAATLALVVVRPGVSAAAAPVRVMPLGDSITGSPGCWRAVLWNRLQSAGFADVDFVGTLPPQGCGVAHDGDNEGHGGILATNMASQNQLPPWLSATRPDVVLMHLGTNDVWNNRSPQEILAAFTTLVNQMRASNPAMRVLVAKIIPMNPSNCGECGARVVAFNNAIPGWASSLSTSQSPIIVVDQWTGFSTSSDTTDGVHPNSTTGTQKMADRWFPALTSVLGGVIPTNPPTTPPPPPPTTAAPPPPPTTAAPPPPTTAAPPPPGGCTAAVSVNQWNGGFVATVRVTAGNSAINGWAVSLTLPSGATIANAWNANRSASTGAVRFTNMPYNGGVPAAGQTEFGFQSGGTASSLTPSCTAS
jgi:lysophospholipase L1-like esterase